LSINTQPNFGGGSGGGGGEVIQFLSEDNTLIQSFQ
jgi:hypothetical protein